MGRWPWLTVSLAVALAGLHGQLWSAKVTQAKSNVMTKTRAKAMAKAMATVNAMAKAMAKVMAKVMALDVWCARLPPMAKATAMLHAMAKAIALARQAFPRRGRPHETNLCLCRLTRR